MTQKTFELLGVAVAAALISVSPAPGALWDMATPLLDEPMIDPETMEEIPARADGLV